MANKTYQFSGSFEPPKVIAALKERVRFRAQGSSKSGSYFDDGSFHGLVTQQAFKDTNPAGELTDAELKTQMGRFTEAAVLKALRLVFSGSSLIDPPGLVTVLTEPRNVVGDPLGELHGFEFCISQAADVIVQLKAVILHLDGDGEVTLYLYKRGDATPVWSGVAQAEAGRFTVTDLTDCYLSFRNEKATQFYFGYKPSELGALKPYSMDESLENCFALLCATPVQVNQLPGYASNLQYPSRAMGLNVEVQSMWDHTEKIVRSASAFDELIGLCGTAMLLEQILFGTRLNGTERLIKEAADRFAVQMDLSGALPVSDSPQVEGLRTRIRKVVAELKQTFTKREGAVV